MDFQLLSYTTEYKKSVLWGSSHLQLELPRAYTSSSVLGPLLFLIYIDGLSGIQLSGGTIVLFGNDLLLYRVVTCLEDLGQVQGDIDELCKWVTLMSYVLN